MLRNALSAAARSALVQTVSYKYTTLTSWAHGLIENGNYTISWVSKGHSARM